jgi:hypothetical protein
MKVFITFLALVVVNVNAMVFHDDLRIYKNLQETVETAAENTAHSASMYFDKESYAEGYLVYDTDEVVKWITSVTKRCMENDSTGMINAVHSKVYLFDESGVCHVLEDGVESKSYEFEFPCSSGGDDSKSQITEPSIEVFIQAEINDPFRQPFAEAYEVTGHCVYSNHHK